MTPVPAGRVVLATKTGRSGQSMLLELIWAAHHALLAAGFANDDIYVAPGNEADAVVTLRTQGKEFNIVVGTYAPWTFEELAERWNRFVLSYNARELPEADLLQTYDAWMAINGGAVGFIVALGAKGIALPAHPADEHPPTDETVN